MAVAEAPQSATITTGQRDKTSTSVLVGQILCVLVPLAIWFSPLDLAPQIKHAYAILAFMVIAWITEATEFALAGFIGCFLFWALGVVKFDVAFSGFADATAWFLFAAMLIGLVASQSGLARRLAFTVMKHVGVTYPRILLGLIITDFLLTFIVPSGLARVVILASIALALTEAFRAARGTNIARGMFLILTYTGNIFDKMILAGAGAITAAGAMQKFGGVEVLWGVWLFAFLPASIITVLAAWRLTLYLYPPEQGGLSQGREYFEAELAKMGPWSVAETKAAILVGAAILLWVTDFLHHIPPTMVALGVGLASLLPRIGVLGPDDMRRLNYMPVFFVAEAVSMGNVLEATKGLDILTKGVFGWIEPFLTNIFSITAIFYWVAFVYHFLLASEISMLGTSIPLVME
jgi:anion transporter